MGCLLLTLWAEEEEPCSDEYMQNKGQTYLRGHQIAPGYPSLIGLACFLQGHWTSEQGSAAFAGWLGKTDEVVPQCYVPASCTLPQVVVHGTSWIETRSEQQERMLLLGPPEEIWS